MQGSLYEKLKLINKYFIEKKSTKLNGIFPTTSKFNSQQSRNTLTPTTSQGGKQKQNKSRAQQVYSNPSQHTSQMMVLLLVKILNPFKYI